MDYVNWLITENEDSIDQFLEERQAANCKDLVAKLLVYDECESSRGCSLSLQDFQERTELVSEVAEDCSNP